MKITVELSEETLQLLAALDEHASAEATLVELAARAADGVCRPGAWERQWLHQAFSDAWEEHLEPDPQAPRWRERPCRR
jgi:hypothetical protein